MSYGWAKDADTHAHDYCIANASELDYQWHKPLDIWSHALWLGAALEHMKRAADNGDEHARLWIDRTPEEVKAVWPGIFPEFPYRGEPEEERASRASTSAVREVLEEG